MTMSNTPMVSWRKTSWIQLKNCVNDSHGKTSWSQLKRFVLNIVLERPAEVSWRGVCLT
jgi:hypothetical protein